MGSTIVHGITPFLGPSLALVGAWLVAWSFTRSLAHAVRGRRAARPVPLLPLGLKAVAFLLLAVLPFTRFLAMIGTFGRVTPLIVSGFGDRLGAEGYPRLEGAHRGVDVAAKPATPVLAAADGHILVAADNGDACGRIVVVDHRPHGFRTIYCHLTDLSVTPGEDVRRGQRIGRIGMSGQRAWPGYEHVHWEMRRGDVHEDPLPKTAGCFDATRAYPADRLVLTYPVPC